MKKKKWFNLYLFIALLWGCGIEIINTIEGNTAGIGLMIYCLIMIVYYQIFPKERKKI